LSIERFFPERARVKSVLFLGGNGHRPARLEPVREVLTPRPGAFAIRDVAYPPAASFDELLSLLADDIGRGGPVALVYATGIGALVGLALRSPGPRPRSRPCRRAWRGRRT
jgi:hypothetical protein